MKISLIIGWGKIVHGLLYPCFQENRYDDTIFICAVKLTEKWQKCKNSHSTLRSKLISYKGQEIFTEQWFLNADNETFDDFAKRCFKAGRPGVWMYENGQMLNEAVIKSNVVGVSIGVDSFENFLCSLDTLRIPECTIYAFENKPDVIGKIADRHKIEVIPCQVDRVVVSRKIDISSGTITVRLGLDPSESIVIYDKKGHWNEILKADKDPHLVVTSNSEILGYTLKKKQYGKNLIHKLLCQLAVIDKKIGDVANLPLYDVIKHIDITYIETILPLIVTAIVVNIFSEWKTYFSKQSCLDIYDELMEYSKNSMLTVINDKSDTIGRIIHLETRESAKMDLQILLLSFEALIKSLSQPIAPQILLFLQERIGALESKRIVENLNEIAQVLSKNTYEKY